MRNVWKGNTMRHRNEIVPFSTKKCLITLMLNFWRNNVVLSGTAQLIVTLWTSRQWNIGFMRLVKIYIMAARELFHFVSEKAGLTQTYYLKKCKNNFTDFHYLHSLLSSSVKCLSKLIHIVEKNDYRLTLTNKTKNFNSTVYFLKHSSVK